MTEPSFRRADLLVLLGAIGALAAALALIGWMVFILVFAGRVPA